MNRQLEPVRWLKPLSWVYRVGIAARNLTFSAGLRRVHRAPVPVVSVGNLSAGGTGKTQLVLWLAERCLERGLRPGIVARGYRRPSRTALNDEGRMLARRLPGIPQEQDPDRVAAIRRLCARERIDLVLVDDGFQHRRLQRDLDIVVVDAIEPFDRGLLPSGWLREPPSALRRAHQIVAVATDPDLFDSPVWQMSLRRIRGVTGAPIATATTEAVGVASEPEGTFEGPESLRGQRVVAIAGIARPERFARLLERLGAIVARTHWFPDHLPIPGDALREIAAEARRLGAVPIWTEKDEAKGGWEIPHRVLRVGLVVDDGIDLARLLPGLFGGEREA